MMASGALQLAEHLVRAHEGLRLVVYDDATGQPLRQGDTIKGHPTIGVGRNLAGRGISKEEAAVLLQRDLLQAMRDAAAWLGSDSWGRLSAPRQAALIDFALQLGAPRLAGFRRACAALRLGDFERTAAEMRNSAWARQVPARAATIAGIVATGRMP